MGADILNVLFLYDFFIFFQVYYILGFDKVTYVSFLFKSILSGRLKSSLWKSGVLLFSESVNIVFTFFYKFIDFIILLHTLKVVEYKEYMIWLVSFSKFSDDYLLLLV